MSTTPDPDTPPPAASCPLLELPAELRNRIYRLVLCKENPVRVISTGYEREGLLSSCKQVRQETLKIYYYENEFTIETHNFDSDNLLAFTRITRRLGLTGRKSTAPRKSLEKVGMQFSFRSSDACWENLLEWMRRIHAGKLQAPSRSPERQARQQDLTLRHITFYAMSFTATQLKSQPWPLVHDVLRGHRAILGNEDERWLDKGGSMGYVISAALRTYIAHAGLSIILIREPGELV